MLRPLLMLLLGTLNLSDSGIYKMILTHDDKTQPAMD
jgi:hypothetical protein